MMDGEGLRSRLKAELPVRIGAALAGYERFTAEEPPADAKGFAAWHAAAKAALAHVEVLVKLLRWADDVGEADAGDDAEQGLGHLLRQARQAIGQMDDADDDS